MKSLTVCISFVCLFEVLSASPAHLAKWESFKAKHGKQHPAHEDAERMQRFLARDAEIEEHNARYAVGLESFSRQHSRYSDLSDEELDRVAFGHVHIEDGSPLQYVPVASQVAKPASFDWETNGTMPPVRTQGDCGSCYAFAATAIIEWMLKRKFDTDYDLSEQRVIDCSYRKYAKNKANSGCNGGFSGLVFKHFNESGVVWEATYPYTSGKTGTHGACDSKQLILNVIKGKLTIWRLKATNEEDLTDLLYERGPFVVALALEAGYKQKFVELGEGVFDHEGTSNGQPSHTVVVVGYGEEGGVPYWRVRNSWGTNWGVGGYGKIRRGKNICNMLKDGVVFAE